ncbi:MAG: hypothetical protein A2664_00990 [Candidatus Taylorbacteria bacterium RIFCSPHIGHO2_01_FULL_46_22b]|uniref:Fibronectin type-III domain-containing protein n=1 Tax=Candidatus Taylorbacteria bacterium RIFCSPHIGHO2_01_FULL_46_22b TaxID=1802301 RepID=A0A1G2M1Z7_9BACT|nr:MAG: hypothetical protein A2664_00990 [Candidatus Taylorbacteria bacterium RIFCSPHIGHO2_01_FULL_46_22b]
MIWSTLGVLALSVIFPLHSLAAPVSITGYGWSDTIGWIDLAPPISGGGVFKQDSGALTGYAWSDNIGWIKFGGLSNFPSGNGTESINSFGQPPVETGPTNLTAGLQLWHKLGDNQNSIAPDSSSNGYSGAYRNFPAVPTLDLRISGVYASVFDGVNDHISIFSSPFGSYPTIGNTTSNYGVSVAVWFKTTSDGVILGQNDPTLPPSAVSGHVPAIYVDTNGKVRVSMFWHGSVTNQIVSSSSYNDGVWHHLVATYNAGVESLYIDTTLIGTQVQPEIGYNSSYYYLIGTGFAGGLWPAAPSGWFYFNGSMSDFRVYDHSLSGSEILQVYTFSNTPPSPPSAQTGDISGWIRACAGMDDVGAPNQSLPNNTCTGSSRTDGWDGWISLKGATTTSGPTAYQTFVTQNNKLSGWAWGGDVVGWVAFTGGLRVTQSATCEDPETSLAWDGISGADSYFLYQNEYKEDGTLVQSDRIPLTTSNTSFTNYSVVGEGHQGHRFEYRLSIVIGGVEGPLSPAVSVVSPLCDFTATCKADVDTVVPLQYVNYTDDVTVNTLHSPYDYEWFADECFAFWGTTECKTKNVYDSPASGNVAYNTFADLQYYWTGPHHMFATTTDGVGNTAKVRCLNDSQTENFITVGTVSPSSLTLTPDTTSGFPIIQITWIPPSHPNSPNVADAVVLYQLKRDGDPLFGGLLLANDPKSRNDTGLEYNTLYDYELRAIYLTTTEGLLYEYSNPIVGSVTSPDRPLGAPIPSCIPLSSSPTNAIQVSWIPLGPPENRLATGYMLYEFRSGLGYVLISDAQYTSGVIPAANTTYNHTGLTPGSTHYYRITSVTGNPPTQASGPREINDCKTITDPSCNMNLFIDFDYGAFSCGNQDRVTFGASADSCQVRDPSGAVVASGTFGVFETPSLAQNTTYTLSCSKTGCPDQSLQKTIVVSSCPFGFRLDCFFEPPNTDTSPVVGRAVNLETHIFGGVPPYSITWTDTEGLAYPETGVSGGTFSAETQEWSTTRSIRRVYSTVGPKTLTVNVTDSDGLATSCTLLAGTTGPDLKGSELHIEEY